MTEDNSRETIRHSFETKEKTSSEVEDSYIVHSYARSKNLKCFEIFLLLAIEEIGG